MNNSKIKNLIFGEIFQNNWGEMSAMRIKINKITYIFMICLHIATLIIFLDSNLPLGMKLTQYLLAPLTTFGLLGAIDTYLFNRNYFHIIFAIFSVGLFGYWSSIVISAPYDPSSYYFVHNVQITIECFLLGLIIPIALSPVFKAIHYYLLDGTKFYYPTDIKETLNNQFKTLNQTSAQQSTNRTIDIQSDKSKITKYDQMNETELNVQLKLAIKEDRFEDAQTIKSLLQEKFR